MITVRQGLRIVVWMVVLLPRCATAAMKTQPESAPDLRSLMRELCAYQVQMLEREDSRLRYHVKRVDRKGETLRDMVESHDGSVARLLHWNGQTLTAEQNAGEQSRLQALLGTQKIEQRDESERKNRTYGVQLLQAMPTAMRFTLAPQQTALPDVAAKQIVVDFSPDPAYHPVGMTLQILTSLAGRVWISEADHRLLRMELHNTGDVNLAWGLLAKVYPGGNVLYEQRPFQDLYAATHIVLHLKVRELMVRTQALDVETNFADFQRMPQSPSSDDAIRMLLALPVATRP